MNLKVGGNYFRTMEFPKLELEKIIKGDIEEINSSRQKSRVLHGTKDIDASGDEVENSVRRVIRRKLPIKYYVSQGHIVDHELSTSPQLDIIIADNSGSPVLFTAENGTEYFPYESIYAFGEIKSTYYSNKKYVQSFVTTTQGIYEKLNRENTPPDMLSQDLSLVGSGGLKFDYGDKRPYKNPIFKFMIFVEANDFSTNDIKEILKGTDEKYLPNIICLINKGVVLKAKINQTETGPSLGPINLIPEFIPEDEKQNSDWVFVEFGDNADKSGANFAFMIYALNQHLRNCLVMRPDTLKYFNRMFNHKGHIIK